ncbi:MAG: N-acetyltransferase [Desulfovibrio desulfuricans]|nr:N-acetyltransferase [Desulfovibrio desulfuricans]
MVYHYKHITDERVRSELYNKMIVEGLADAAFPCGRMRLDEWLRLTAPRDGNVFGVSLDIFGHYHGMALFREREYRMWAFDFCSFRAGFDWAVEQARGAFRWIFSITDATSLYGVTPVTHRAARRLAESCGFVQCAVLPSACWLARRGKYVDGVLVLCTPQTLEDSEMGFGGGGGGSAPEVPPTPKAEVTKPVTEAATAARQNQKDKAAKAAGLRSTILTGEGALGANGSNNQGKTLLGQ